MKRCVPILVFGLLALTLATHGAEAQVQGVNSITNNNLVLGAGNNAFMVIGTSGAISIGTGTAYPLSVGTSTALSGFLNIASTGTVTIPGDVGIGTSTVYGAMEVYNTSNGLVGSPPGAQLYLGSNNNNVALWLANSQTGGQTWAIASSGGLAGVPSMLRFYNMTTANEAIDVTATGYVGIGSTVPTAALDVNGAIHATGPTSPGGVPTAMVAGNSCTPEGAMGYDMTNHEPVYCNRVGIWANTSGSGGQFANAYYVVPGWSCDNQISINFSSAGLAALGITIPSTATAVQVTLNEAAGEVFQGQHWTNFCLDGNASNNSSQCSPASTQIGVVYSSGGSVSGSATAIVSAGPHTFTTYESGVYTCSLVITGYFY